MPMIPQLNGHRSVRTQLSHFFDPSSGELSDPPRSLLFEGPFGVGKRTTALRTAQWVNCPSFSSGSHGVRSCSTCRSIEKGDHSDVMTLSLQKASNQQSIGVEEVRSLLPLMKRSSHQGSMRICIIEDAHTLTPESADALLKTSEEGHGGFFFITRRPGEVINTLKSRSFQLSFGYLSRSETLSALRSSVDDFSALDEDTQERMISNFPGSPGMITWMIHHFDNPLSMAIMVNRLANLFQNPRSASPHKLIGLSEKIMSAVDVEDHEDYTVDFLFRLLIDRFSEKARQNPDQSDRLHQGMSLLKDRLAEHQAQPSLNKEHLLHETLLTLFSDDHYDDTSPTHSMG